MSMSIHTLEEILEVLEQHERQAAHVLNMVPAENSMSTVAKLPMLLDVYHRYLFNVAEAPDEWNFRGAQGVARLEAQALALLRELTGAEYVNLRPLSGLHGMTLVLSALGNGPGSTVLSVAPEQGGHYATASLAARLGLRTYFMTGPDAHTIDFEHLANALLEHRPALVYIDQSNCLFPLDVRKLSEVVHLTAPGTLVHVDCSHWMGLVLGRQMPNPLEVGADSFGGSTHKSFPGPQKAIFATHREDLSKRFYQAQYEMISSHHLAGAISLGLALLEFKQRGGLQYAATMVENTLEFGRQLHARKVPVVATDRGFSAGHQLWIRTALMGVDAFQASERLYRVGIRVNAFPGLPGIPEPVLRIGLNEATYLGLLPEDMATLAETFTEALMGREPSPQTISALRHHRRGATTSADPQTLARVLGLVARAMMPGVQVDVSLLAQTLLGSVRS